MAYTQKSVVSVIVDLAIDRQLDYQIPPRLQEQIKVGMQVKVPIKNKLYTAIITEIKQTSTLPSLREIDSISPHSASITPLSFCSR